MGRLRPGSAGDPERMLTPPCPQGAPGLRVEANSWESRAAPGVLWWKVNQGSSKASGEEGLACGDGGVGGGGGGESTTVLFPHYSHTHSLLILLCA